MVNIYSMVIRIFLTFLRESCASTYYCSRCAAHSLSPHGALNVNRKLISQHYRSHTLVLSKQLGSRFNLYKNVMKLFF